MKLNHLDLHVPDVGAATRIFRNAYFDLTLVDMRGQRRCSHSQRRHWA